VQQQPAIPCILTISALFISLVVILGAVLTWQNYSKTSDIIRSSAEKMYDQVATELLLDIEGTYCPVGDMLGLLAVTPITRADLLEADSLILVALPLRNRQEETIGVLSLIYRGSAGPRADREQGNLLAFISALSGFAAVSLESRQLLMMQKALLDEDFAFVAECNLGAEFMAPEKLDRLQRIAAYRWMRTLDDRLGVSWEQRQRMQRVPASTLPVSERLLDNKVQHLIERHAVDRLPVDNPWGFKMDTPEYLYNRGELYNLEVGRGTLTAEERYKINDHIMQTIIMLEKLPYPKHLRDVPLIAGCHHETMDGRGYLQAEQLDAVDTSEYLN
jgi:hypothetical protein